MNKKLVVSASLLAKSQVAAYTRKDGTMVQSHDNGRQAAAPEPVNQKVLAKLKTSHHMDARALKSSLGSSLSSGDTEGHDGKPMTYGDVKGHLNTMRMQLGSKPEHAEHLKHAQYALNQSFGLNHAPVSEKHAKLIGAALSGKTRMDDNGVVQHAGGAPSTGAKKLTVRASVAKKAAAKTGSAAPERKVNIGSEKWPLHARSSEKLPTKHADGSTHHVGGFEAPSGGAGDHFLHHEGKTYSFTGKRGVNMKTGERSFEFAHHDHEKGLEHRAWVTRTGHLMND